MKIKTHMPAAELEHEVLHAHVDFENKTVAYQLAAGGPMHHAPLREDLALELLADIEMHAQEQHAPKAKAGE